MATKNSIDLSKHPAIESYEDIKKICRPIIDLFKITFFRYLRIYPDKSRIHLCTNPEWTSLFYSKGFYNIAWFDSNQLINPKSIEILWDVKANTDDNIVGIEARNHFNIHHGISIIRPQKSYYEVYDLATYKDNASINDLYLNNLDLFQRFFFYFKNQARTLLQECDKKRIKLPNLSEFKKEAENNIVNKSEDINIFLDSTKTNRFYINTVNGDIYLTKKETECIYWVLRGKSAEEIGMILKCSKRTIEIHINNIKKKLGVGKITQAIKIAIDSGVINVLKYDLERMI